jgi:hypothetical protein
MKRPEYIDYRPVRQVPVATEEEVQRMLQRLRTRGKIADRMQVQAVLPLMPLDVEAEHRETSVREALSQPPETSAPLAWCSPIKGDDGPWTVKDTTGLYTVLAERISEPKGWRYLAFRGSVVLGPPCANAECAKSHADADHRKVV